MRASAQQGHLHQTEQHRSCGPTLQMAASFAAAYFVSVTPRQAAFEAPFQGLASPRLTVA
eukprot:6181348-Pleurochrysis_carterae.AAC.2